MSATTNRPNVAERQLPLRSLYRRDPEPAQIVDKARTLGTAPGDPFHLRVEIGEEYEDTTLDVGVHRGVGGLHDEPNPGEILCAALAACQDQVVRMVANLLGVELLDVRAEVEGDVDLRGTLLVEPDVRPGFQAMRCAVDITPAPGSDPERVRKVAEVAERCCVVLDTLREGVAIDVSFTTREA